jgi:hypothetical protein
VLCKRLQSGVALKICNEPSPEVGWASDGSEV